MKKLVIMVLALIVASPALAGGHRHGHTAGVARGGGGGGHHRAGIGLMAGGGKGIATAASPRSSGGRARSKPSWDLMDDLSRSSARQERTASRAAPHIRPVHVSFPSASHHTRRHHYA